MQLSYVLVIFLVSLAIFLAVLPVDGNEHNQFPRQYLVNYMPPGGRVASSTAGKLVVRRNALVFYPNEDVNRKISWSMCDFYSGKMEIVTGGRYFNGGGVTVRDTTTDAAYVFSTGLFGSSDANDIIRLVNHATEKALC